MTLGRQSLTQIRFLFLFMSLALLFTCTRKPMPTGVDGYHVSVAVDGQGTVGGWPAQADAVPGAQITLTASPGPGWTFVGWYDSTASTDNPITLTADRDLRITARFAPVPGAGMVLVQARGERFTMGSTDPYARGDEQPVRAVRFTHDFYMDRCEVTQGAYRAVTGQNPAAASGGADVGDSFPVFSVSWYQAALYCNALSKSRGYDTVYTYTALCGEMQQCPYVLENLAIHYDRFGYRLPTEAEWEFACRGGTAGAWFWGDGAAADSAAAGFAWFSGNAGDHAHPSGLKQANPLGLLDMCGNVGEWVDDWMAPYRAADSIDPCGPAGLTLEQYESGYGRPVRGGSYLLGSSFLRSSARSGPYSIGARAVQNDIGFRTVLGAFFAATVHDTTPVPADTADITFVCAKSDLVNFIGTHRVKLAFVSGGAFRRKLHYVDFSEPGMALHALPDTAPAYGLSISPDGRRIACSSNQVGFSGLSRVTVRSLADRSTDAAALPTDHAFLPHWWVEPATGDTFIVYTSGASPDNQPAWVTEQTYRQRMSGLNASGAPIPFPTPGSYHGGLSADGRFLGTSYPVSRLVDMGISVLEVGDTNIPYFTSPWNGRTDNPQTCNLTMSPTLSDPGDALLLDFGCPAPQTSLLTGGSYGFHAVIFKCTMQMLSYKHVARWFVIPSEYAEWDDLQYTNHPDFATAMASQASPSSPGAVYVLNVKDSSYLKVATGTGISAPVLWIDPSDVPQQPDPYRMFARYDLPIQSSGQFYMVEKMKLFWHGRAQPECVFLGSSPAYFGIDPFLMPRVKTLNMGWLAEYTGTGLTVALHYVLHLTGGIKALAIELNAGFLKIDERTSRLRLTGMYDSEGYKLDSANGFWRAGVPAAISAKCAAFDSADWPHADAAGFPLQRMSGGWGPTVIDWTGYEFTDTAVQYNLSLIRALADSCRARGIPFLMVQFPESPWFDTTSSIGRYGPSRTVYAQVVQWLRSLESANPYFHFYDANNYGSHDYIESDFWDCNHLSYSGAQKLSPRIDSIIAGYLGR